MQIIMQLHSSKRAKVWEVNENRTTKIPLHQSQIGKWHDLECRESRKSRDAQQPEKDKLNVFSFLTNAGAAEEDGQEDENVREIMWNEMEKRFSTFFSFFFLVPIENDFAIQTQIQFAVVFFTRRYRFDSLLLSTLERHNELN